MHAKAQFASGGWAFALKGEETMSSQQAGNVDRRPVMYHLSKMEVIELVLAERRFQDDTGRGVYQQPHDVLEWCAIANDYLDEAFELASCGDPEEAMGFLRRVAAICFAAMEQHGAPARQGGGTYEP